MTDQRRKSCALTWTAFAVACLCARGVRAEVVSLAQLEQSALKNRPALAREAARARAADADVRKAASAYYPQFALKAGADVAPGRQLLRVGRDVTGSDTEYYLTGAPDIRSGGKAFVGYPRSSLELSGSTSLYDFGRTQAAVEAGKHGHAAALASRAATEGELRKAVRETYLNWVLQSELLRLAQEALSEATQRREHVGALIAEGQKPQGELTPARAEELLARLELSRAERELGAARLSVEQAVGTALSASAEPDLTVLEPESALPDASELQSKHMHALQQRLKAAQVFADAQGRLNRPQLGLGISAGIRSSTQQVTVLGDPEEAPEPKRETKVFPLYGLGLTLNIPLWDGGLTRASVEAARAHADEAKADLQEFLQQRELAQREAELDAENARARLATTEELVTVCAARLKDAEDGYELGVSTIEMIGQARALLRRAKMEALLARVDHAAARLRMVRHDTALRP